MASSLASLRKASGSLFLLSLAAAGALVDARAAHAEENVAVADFTFGAPGRDDGVGEYDRAPVVVNPAPDAEKPHRRFGLGTMFGGGLSGYTVAAGNEDVSARGYLFAVSLPTLDAQVFLPHGYSIDLSSSITGTAFWASMRSAYFTQDAFFNFNLGKHVARGIMGPGLGFTAAAGGGKAAGSIRFPAEIGLELLTKNEQFGFKIMGRPWLEVPISPEGTSLGGGVVAMIGASGYFVK